MVESTRTAPMPGSAVSDDTGPLAFAFRGVTKQFGTQPVLAGLDFAVSPGTVVGLLGANGAGKTTLLKCLLGLLKIDAGTVTVGGHDAWDPPAAIKARIGYVDQHPKFYPWMKGKHLLPYVGSFYPQWDEPLLKRLAEQWDVPLNKAFGKLSPGQQQKIALLAAVGHDPDLLVLDEPVSALDPAARRAFLRSLLELTADAGRTVVLSTHITSDVERVASHVAVLDHGHMLCFEELGELKDRVKRLRVTSEPPLEPGFAVDGSLRTEVEGHAAVAVVAEDPAGIVEALRARGGLDVAVDDLNLEEIFIELVGSEGSDAR